MTYNRLEDTIKNVYLKIDVTDVLHLDFELIAARLGFSVMYIQGISKYIGSIKTFCIKKSLSPEEQWQDFGHELCHALWHAGSQLNMPIDWRLFQEWQAKSFAYEACIPRFLLEKELAKNPFTDPVVLIAEQFGVTSAFAEKRFLLHVSRMTQNEEALFRQPILYYA